MQNTLALFLNAAAGRLVVGALNLSSDHPLVLCVLLAIVTWAAAEVMIDVVGVRRPTHKRTSR